MVSCEFEPLMGSPRLPHMFEYQIFNERKANPQRLEVSCPGRTGHGDRPVRTLLACFVARGSEILMRAAAAALCLLALAVSEVGRTAELPDHNGIKPVEDYSYLFAPFKLADKPNLQQSVFFFAGRTNSGNLWNTMTFGAAAPGGLVYDNFILGGAYQRDLLEFNSGFLVGAELGLADRFGHYRICCDSTSYSNNLAHSLELWGGAVLRHRGVTLFDTVGISPGFVFGLSAVTNPIGQEALHQVDHAGSAKVLFYLGFDLAFTLASLPNTELVFRVHHRSGGYGTLGGLKEGNNAQVIGIRHRF